MVDNISDEISGHREINPETCQRYHDLNDEEKKILNQVDMTF